MTTNSKIEIYTRSLCAYSQRAKELLRIKGVEFIEYDITDSELWAAEKGCLRQKTTVPEIFVNGRLLGGCADLFNLDERGELDALLGRVTPAAESPQSV